MLEKDWLFKWPWSNENKEDGKYGYSFSIHRHSCRIMRPGYWFDKNIHITWTLPNAFWGCMVDLLKPAYKNMPCLRYDHIGPANGSAEPFASSRDIWNIQTNKWC